MSPPSGSKRWWLWWPLLGLAAWLALFSDKSPDGSDDLSLPTRSQPPAAGTAQTHARAAAARSDAGENLPGLVPRDQLFPPRTAESSAPPPRDLFAARSWNPPSPPPRAEPAAAPIAPPPPYTYLGKKLEGEVWEVFLARGEQTFVVREGQALEGTYRIDSIQPPSLNLTYLPMGQSQTLPIGETR